jgi:uncharacterized protein (TIGR02145 family)
MKKKLLFFVSLLSIVSFILITYNCKKDPPPEDDGCVPPAAPTLTEIAPIGAGGTLNLKATHADPTALFHWTGPNSFVSDLQNPTISNITAAATGLYSATVMVNGCTSAPATTMVAVKESGTWQDPRAGAGEVYATIKIGNQVWLAENLRYNDPINPSGCKWYNDDVKNEAFGRLYNYLSVTKITLGISPWRIPTKADWETLVNYLGGPTKAGKLMKYPLEQWWNTPSEKACTNGAGFNAKGSGCYVNLNFIDLRQFAYYWSSTSYNQIMWIVKLTYAYIDVYYEQKAQEDYYSVRLVKNN